MKKRHTLLLLLIGTNLGGCSTTPDIIAEQPPGNIQLVEVQQNFDRFKGHRVRWGGVILETKNLEQTTESILLAYPLDSSARPKIESRASGRFKIKLSGFKDPAVYGAQREMTIIGTIIEMRTEKIGEFDYNYTVIDVERFYLWPEREPEYDYYYDPFYYPWYPYWHPYYYPYYRRPYRH